MDHTLLYYDLTGLSGTSSSPGTITIPGSFNPFITGEHSHLPVIKGQSELIIKEKQSNLGLMQKFEEKNRVIDVDTNENIERNKLIIIILIISLFFLLKNI